MEQDVREILLIINPSALVGGLHVDADGLEPVILDTQALLRAALTRRHAHREREDARGEVRDLVAQLRGLSDRHAAAAACEAVAAALQQHWSGGLIVIEEADDPPVDGNELLDAIEVQRRHAAQGRRLGFRQRALDPARTVEQLALYLQEPDVRVSLVGQEAGVREALGRLELLGVPATAFVPPLNGEAPALRPRQVP